jgi:RNA polymerase sigma-70 factor (ECF subfamily)
MRLFFVTFFFLDGIHPWQRALLVDPYEDEELMLQVRDGQLEALAELYRRHRTRLLGFFARLTGNPHRSEDLVHDVFLRMLKYRQSFRPGCHFATWMHQVARNAHHDSWRKSRYESPVDTDQLPDHEALVSHESPPDWQTGRNQEVALLQDALASLPVELREALILSRFQDLRYDQVAEVLDCSVGAVKMRVFRAMQELRHNFLKLAGKERV